MPPLSWATDAQTEFLSALIPEYKDAQKTELRLRNSAYNKFWASLYEAWETAFPERLEVFPTKPLNETLSEEEKETLTKAFQARRERLKTWFRWRTTQKARSRKTAKSKDLVQALAKPTRTLQPAEMYSKLHYKTEIRPQVNAMIKDQGIVDRAAVLNIIKKVTREKFLAGGDDVKSEVESKLADIAKAKAKQNENLGNRKPQQYLDAIQDCPALLGQFLDILAEKTGWAFTVLMGGPDPQSNGDISVASYHVGETELGNQFGTVHPNFEKVYMEPFTEFLVNLFPESIRHSRSLCQEEMPDDMLLIDSSDFEGQLDIRKGREDSEGLESLSVYKNSTDTDSELPILHSSSSPPPAASGSSFGASEFYLSQPSTNFPESESSDAAPNASSSVGTPLSEQPMLATSEASDATPDASLSQFQFSVSTPLSGQPILATSTTTDALAPFQPLFHSDMAASLPFTSTNIDDNASSAWTFPNSWASLDAWTFPNASTTPFAVFAPTQDSVPDASLSMPNASLFMPDASFSMPNASFPVFSFSDAPTVPFAPIQDAQVPDASPSMWNVLNASSPTLSCPDASTNPFTVFPPLQDSNRITSQVPDASPIMSLVHDASPPASTVLSILPPPDASSSTSTTSTVLSILPPPDASHSVSPALGILPPPDASPSESTGFTSPTTNVPIENSNDTTPTQTTDETAHLTTGKLCTPSTEDTYIPSCAPTTTLVPTPAVHHQNDLPTLQTNQSTNNHDSEETAKDTSEHRPPNTPPLLLPSRRSIRTVVPSTRADVMNNIGSRAARVDKENAPALNPVISDKKPTWLSDAHVYLKGCELGEEWVQCVNAWGEFEVQVAQTRTTKGALPSTDLRPDEWIKWAMKGKHGVRPYHIVPNISSPLEFGTQVIKWWYCMQPAFRQGEHKLPTRLSQSILPDNIESEWAPLQKGGPNGLVSVLTLLTWWGKLAPTSTQWEANTLTDWKAMVLDVTEVICAVSGVLASRKRGLGDSLIERVCKRARTK